MSESKVNHETVEKSFKCLQCEKYLTSKGNLKRHMVTTHSDESIKTTHQWRMVGMNDVAAPEQIEIGS